MEALQQVSLDILTGQDALKALYYITFLSAKHCVAMLTVHVPWSSLKSNTVKHVDWPQKVQEIAVQTLLRT